MISWSSVVALLRLECLAGRTYVAVVSGLEELRVTGLGVLTLTSSSS